MVTIKSEREIKLLRESNQIVGTILKRLSEYVKPGVTTKYLDELVESWIIQEFAAKPAFKGYRGFPASICASINFEVVHGIPTDKRKLKDGDIISIDIGAEKDGYFGDSAKTFIVGTVSKKVKDFLKITEESLYKGIEKAVEGNYLGDISNAVQTHVENKGYSVVRDYVGHGIGQMLHEDPSIPNYGRKKNGLKLRSGMTLAIEPMINMGTFKVKTLSDGWTVVTKDKSLSAHFEHVVVVRKDKAEILSAIN